jgi:predicted phage baseplate assembly protein
MVLPAPNLDDRRFQDLVDDAKRLVMRRCPEWTDHNVSDPGVTLIETFAFMTDQLLFRLNQVPDKLYVKFLELIGLRLIPPTPARVPVTFWLSAPAVTAVTVAVNTKVGTLRTESEESVIFSTEDQLDLIPCALNLIVTQGGGADAVVDHTDELRMAREVSAFSPVPQVGDALYLGLTDPVPRCVVRVDFEGRIEGVGVHPDHPPLVWEAWTGGNWTECLVSKDETGGLNRAGGIYIHVPADHTASVVGGERAGWLRGRVIRSEEDFPRYSSSPVVSGLAASTVGGTIEALNADVIEDEVLGTSDGVAGQTFQVLNTPVLAGAAEALVQTSSTEGWEDWEPVENFAASGPEDRHFLLDAVSGEVRFGPAIRERDGSYTQYGKVPDRDVVIRMHRYAVGGGRQGNVGKAAIQTLKSSIPFVSSVENLTRAQGGVDGETMTEAKARGPILLRTRSRAVTAEDYEAITAEAAPEVARVRCLPAGEGSAEAGSVRILVVPAAPNERHRIQFEDLVPDPDTLERISARLDQVRLVGARVSVEPPLYRGVTVVARLVARQRANRGRIQEDAMDALYKLLNPLTGGAGGNGWPFGRPVYTGEVFAALQGVLGVELVEDVRLFGANPVTGERGKETTKLELEPNSLVFSYSHQVRVEER